MNIDSIILDYYFRGSNNIFIVSHSNTVCDYRTECRSAKEGLVCKQALEPDRYLSPPHTLHPDQHHATVLTELKLYTYF